VFAAQAMLLLVAAWRNLHQLNPDAIAYLRIAGYYAGGQQELAVTGYWGPLLSWLAVPLLKTGVAPLIAARVVMAVSGVVFLVGAVTVFRTFRLPPVAMLVGAWIAAAWSVFWSVRNITPDLLMAGLVALAVSATMNLFLSHTRRGGEAEISDGGKLTPAATAGAWWGLAYLAKAVALPLAGLTCAGLAVAALSGRMELRRELALRLALVWLGTALVAGPWIAVLSLHYGKFTFSTTGPIAHALAGPGESAGRHPAMATLHQPDAGRVTQWEEPTRMAYQYWSPLVSGENFQQQLMVAVANCGEIIAWLLPWMNWVDGTGIHPWRRWLGTFDWLGFSAIAVLLAGWCGMKNWQRLRGRRWCWALVPVVLLGGLYLPFFVMAEDNRYFYPALPFLWVLAAGGWGWMSRRLCRASAAGVRSPGFRVVNLSFAVPPLIWLAAALSGIPNQASRSAHELAAQLKVASPVGPISGSGLLPGGRTGLYTAFLLVERWLGDDPQAGPAEFAAAGARVVVTRRGTDQAAALAKDRRWRLMAPENVSTSLQVFIRDNP